MTNKKNNKYPIMKRNNIISDFLSEYNRTDIDSFVEKNIAITNKIYAVLDEKGLKSSDLARMLGKSPSEICKWLSGMHNLTLKSITKIEAVLEVNLINVEPEIEIKYVFLASIKSDAIKNAISNATTKYEDTNVTYAA
jgi:transcriptional regulator with XRE-family HTH domain